MPVNNAIAGAQGEIAEWRRSLHQSPEILYEVHETAAFVAEKLRSFGCDSVETGIGRTGVVAVVEGRLGSGASIALRADMDALPIDEASGVPYASQTPGRMHACGHDGHMAMLLGAARQLADTRNFAGRVVFVFQPAEEGGAGAKAMIEDGLFERYSVDAVFGMHNLPGLPVGRFGINFGAMMASTDEFEIAITGRGGHAAMPHLGVDPILVGSAIVQGLQQVAARNADPLDSVVLSVTQFHAGFTHNVIPQTATISGTVRSLRAATRDLAERRITEIATGIAAAHGAGVVIDYDRNYPVTLNDAEAAHFCGQIAASVVGAANVDSTIAPLMGGEDFSYMLEAKPGAFIFIGNGETAALHHPAYDFDDEALAYGASYWVALVEAALKPESIALPGS